MEPVLRTISLSKEYPVIGRSSEAVKALCDVSLEIDRGNIVAILGLNGAGKSTLTKCLLELVKPTKGEIFIFGKPLLSGSWRNRVGYLPEIFRITSRRNSREYLNYFGELSGLTGGKLNIKIDEVLSLVGLYDDSSRPVNKFSKGMMLRLGIAQALINSPELLFLDEPTEGLDLIGKMMIRNLLTTQSEKGATIIINSHLLSEIEMIAHKAIILHKGRILQQGTLNEMIPKESRFIVEVPNERQLPDPWIWQENNSISTCEVTSTTKLQQLLSQLDMNKIQPISVKPLKTTLEDIFFSLLKDI